MRNMYGNDYDDLLTVKDLYIRVCIKIVFRKMKFIVFVVLL